MKKRTKWLLGIAVVTLVAWGALRAVSARKDQQLALAAASAAL